MTTYSQLVYNRNGTRLQKKVYKDRLKILEGCPQKKGTCLFVGKITPKKPNSALRPFCRIVILSTKKRINCHIPGGAHNLKIYSNVLIRGGRAPDIPGIRYRVIRISKKTGQKSDLLGLLSRHQARSKHGRRCFERVPKRNRRAGRRPVSETRKLCKKKRKK